MKVLASTSPARGHLFPLVPILDELAGTRCRCPRPTCRPSAPLSSPPPGCSAACATGRCDRS
jgi:hypothetical protein